jgi:hypothetical protein
MNRHHPYAGFENGPRRGGHAAGPGPDRFHSRFSDRGGRGRGYGRGRGFGAAANHDTGYGHGHANYSQSAPSGEPSLYNNADSSQAQHPYYQNNNYGGGLTSNVAYPAAGPNDYNEAYDNYGGTLKLRISSETKSQAPQTNETKEYSLPSDGRQKIWTCSCLIFSLVLNSPNVVMSTSEFLSVIFSEAWEK